MTQGKNRKLAGVIPAIITPMNEDGEVSCALLERQAAYLSEAGVQGFFIGGTTAEGAYLTAEEKRKIYGVVRDVVAGRQFLCAACIRPSTREVAAEMRGLADLAPDFVVAVTPFYLGMRQQDIKAHFRILAAAAPAPLILYNIPGNTHNPMALETVLELAAEEKIAGIKDSSGDFVQFSRGLLGPRPPGFAWIQGEDYLDAPSLMLGCDGVVTGLGNARIEPYVRMVRAAREADWAAVRDCQARINRLYGIIRLCGNSIAAVKAAAGLAGRGSRWLRQRSLSLSDEQLEQVRRVLEEFDAREPH